ncbi:MAG: hypothetical protein ACOH5I_24995 [Oligoflexus sp.]
MLIRTLIIIAVLSLPTILVAKAKKERKKTSPISLSLNLTQMQAAKIDPVTVASASFIYRAHQNIQVAMSQAATKNYFINEDGEALSIADSVISLTWLPQNLSRDIDFFSSLTSTLPISERSRRNNLHTVTSINLGVNWQALQRLGIGSRIGGGYQFNEYDTEPTGSDGSGAALRHYYFEIAHNANLKLIDKLGLGYDFSWFDIYYHRIDEEAANSIGRDLSDQSYQLTIYLSYQLWQMGFTFGYIQGNMLGFEGLRDYLLFDEEQSIGFASISLNF